MKREIVSTQVFDRLWQELGQTEEQLRDLQNYLVNNPEAGDLIQGTGGLRKVRFQAEGKGKRGGCRVLYVDFIYYEKIYLMSVYHKSTKTDLTEKEKVIFKNRLDDIKKDLR